MVVPLLEALIKGSMREAWLEGSSVGFGGGIHVNISKHFLKHLDQERNVPDSGHLVLLVSEKIEVCVENHNLLYLNKIIDAAVSARIQRSFLHSSSEYFERHYIEL